MSTKKVRWKPPNPDTRPQRASTPKTWKYDNDDQIKENEMDGTCSTHGGDEKYNKILAGKPEEKTPLGRSGRRWENILNWFLNRYGVTIRIGLMWLNGGLLCTW
jgi:hypothetical protein